MLCPNIWCWMFSLDVLIDCISRLNFRCTLHEYLYDTTGAFMECTPTFKFVNPVN